PPDVDDTEALWEAIDKALPAGAPAKAGGPALAVVRDDPAAVRRRAWWANPWIRTAAVLLFGVLIGRLSTRLSARATSAPSVADSGLTTAESGRAAPLPATELPAADRIATT